MNDFPIRNFAQTQLIGSKSTNNFNYNITTKNSASFNTHPTKPEQMTDQYFQAMIHKAQTTNAPIVQSFKLLDYNGRIKLQKYCLANFDNLPLFMLYELGWQLGLQSINSACTQQLINENYQQLNYAKYDLIKCSYFTFRKILDQYDSLVKSLEIQGLKQSDLKSVIDDFCLMCSVDVKEKQNLYNQFVYAKQIFVNNQPQVRRSMIETSKSKMEGSTPLKSKNTISMLKTANLVSSGVVEKQKNNSRSKGKLQIKPGSASMNLYESARLVKIQIQQLKQKEAQLYSQLLETKKLCADNKNQRYFIESFSKLERVIKKMQKQINSQNQKITSLQKSASDIRQSKTNSKKIDFVFSY